MQQARVSPLGRPCRRHPSWLSRPLHHPGKRYRWRLRNCGAPAGAAEFNRYQILVLGMDAPQFRGAERQRRRSLQAECV